MRISLITGANKGIGFEVARQLGGLGEQKVLVGARNEERGRKAAAALRAEGVDAAYVHVDVTDAAGLERAAKRMEREYGRLDALVNNAGIAILDWNLRPGRVPLDVVRRTYETNVVGVIAVTDAMLPLLRRSAAGRIVNVSSAASLGNPNNINTAYATSKVALNHFTRQLAMELKGTGVTANVFHPGEVKTDLWAEMKKDVLALGTQNMLRWINWVEETGGDQEKAIDILRAKGAAKAAKRSAREASEGAVGSYIHMGGRIGVLVEINCETDFVARNEEFQKLVRDVAMHIAAASPAAVRREDIPADEVERERAVYREQMRESGKPEKIWDKIVEGKLEKFFQEAALLEQPFVKDPDITVGQLVTQAGAKTGENIVVRRFTRFALGE